MRNDVSESWFAGRDLCLPGAPVVSDGSESERGRSPADRGRRSVVGRAGVLSRPGFDPSRVRVVRVADVESERVCWLWPGRLPLGKLVVVEGDPGLGKSTVLLDLAARITRGSQMPDGAAGVDAADVVLLSAEDGVADTIRPRLEAAGGDLDRVHILEAVASEGGGLRPPELPGDCDALRSVVGERGAVLVVVDPLVAFLAAGVNSWRDHDVRRALHPLAAVAEQARCCIVVVRHLTKGGNLQALYRGGGSIGIAGAARLVLLVAPDPQDESRRVLAVVKSNLAVKAESLAYRLVPDPEHDVARVEWLGTTSYSADELVRQPPDDEERTALAEAQAFLRDAFPDGPRPAAEVKREARDTGISDRTLERARRSLGIESRRDAFGGPYRWHPPEHLAALGEHGQHGEAGEHGESRMDLGIAPVDSSHARQASLSGELGEQGEAAA
jgi:AAA domain